MNTNKGKYCCLPGCTSSSFTLDTSLFLIPNGKKRHRCGADTKKWSQYFFQVLFRFRDPSDKNFGKKCVDGKAFICIQKTNKKSWLKFGSLPTECLPQKSFQKVVLKRKSPLKLNSLIVSKKKHCKNLNDISQDFNLCKTSSQWQ